MRSLWVLNPWWYKYKWISVNLWERGKNEKITSNVLTIFLCVFHFVIFSNKNGRARIKKLVKTSLEIFSEIYDIDRKIPDGKSSNGYGTWIRANNNIAVVWRILLGWSRWGYLGTLNGFHRNWHCRQHWNSMSVIKFGLIDLDIVRQKFVGHFYALFSFFFVHCSFCSFTLWCTTLDYISAKK